MLYEQPELIILVSALNESIFVGNANDHSVGKERLPTPTSFASINNSQIMSLDETITKLFTVC